MSRYHRIVTKFEGECRLCGGCCRDCEDLVSVNGRKLCADHKHRPLACRKFPWGYAVELMPRECGYRVTETETVDETGKGDRIRVSGRTSHALVKGVSADEDEVFPDLYDIQHALSQRARSRVYGPSALGLTEELAQIVGELVEIERRYKAKRKHLRREDWDTAEKACRRVIEALLLYAERRDIVVGDLFTKEEFE